MKVRFPCEHGQWFRHMVDPRAVKPVWCDGGETRLLRPYNELSDPGDAHRGKIRAWVEV